MARYAFHTPPAPPSERPAPVATADEETVLFIDPDELPAPSPAPEPAPEPAPPPPLEARAPGVTAPAPVENDAIAPCPEFAGLDPETIDPLGHLLPPQPSATDDTAPEAVARSKPEAEGPRGLGPPLVVAGPDGLLFDKPFLDKFHPMGILGRGSTALVLRVIELHSDRDVALKFLTERDPSLVKRFDAEWKMLARLRHPKVIEVYGHGEWKGYPYLVMEMVEGETLKDLLVRGGPMSLDKAMGIMSEVLDGLGYLHSQGVLHRDIKPANLFLPKTGGVKIGDLGVAIAPWREVDLTAPGTMIGTPKYMPPEMVIGLPMSNQSDIYSMGVVLFEALTGRPPFVYDTVPAMLTAHVKDERPSALALRPDLPPALDDVLKRSIARRPEDRFPSAAEFLAALKGAIEAPPTRGERSSAGLKRPAADAPARGEPSSAGLKRPAPEAPARGSRAGLKRPPSDGAARPAKGERSLDRIPIKHPAVADDGASAPKDMEPFGPDTRKLPVRRMPSWMAANVHWVVAGAVIVVCLIIMVFLR